eukprot:355249-Chlamydomonas_euryale.AAC.1
MLDMRPDAAPPRADELPPLLAPSSPPTPSMRELPGRTRTLNLDCMRSSVAGRELVVPERAIGPGETPPPSPASALPPAAAPTASPSSLK